MRKNQPNNSRSQRPLERLAVQLLGAWDFILRHKAFGIIAFVVSIFILAVGLVSSAMGNFEAIKWLIERSADLVMFSNSPYFTLSAWCIWVLICVTTIIVVAERDKELEQSRQQLIEELKRDISNHINEELKPHLDKATQAARYLIALKVMTAQHAKDKELETLEVQINTFVRELASRPQLPTDNRNLEDLLNHHISALKSVELEGVISPEEYLKITQVSDSDVNDLKRKLGLDIADKALQKRYIVNTLQQNNRRRFFEKSKLSHDREFDGLKKSFE
jgi:hypothetical protein